MKKGSVLLTAMLFSTVIVPMASAVAADAKKGDKPKDSPGWVVVDEDIWYPFYYDAEDAFRLSEFHYRRNEERAAAREIEKSISWLKFASSHAYPESKKALDDAISSLTKLQMDLNDGEVSSARQLDAAFAKASHALAMFHYFKAANALARNEEQWAARDLEASARYLRNAARSANYEFGKDSVTVFEDIDQMGRLVDRGEVVQPNRLADNLSALNGEIAKLAGTLEKAAK